MQATQEELLLSRVVDGRAGRADWAELELVGRADPAVWRRLGQALRCEATLRGSLDDALGAAESVELPGRRAAVAPRSSRGLIGALGWIAALLCLSLWGWSLHRAPAASRAPVPLQPREPVTALSADAALENYLTIGREEGRILGELPAVIVETRPAGDGDALQVFYLRRLIERATVDEIYELGADEAGIPTRIPVPLTRFISSEPL
ncbi:MAG: hypothetical protein ACE5GW_05275 [Planctomycetota bacterium]